MAEGIVVCCEGDALHITVTVVIAPIRPKVPMVTHFAESQLIPNRVLLVAATAVDAVLATVPDVAKATNVFSRAFFRGRSACPARSMRATSNGISSSSQRLNCVTARLLSFVLPPA
jgi:hypothetical protein